MRKGMENKEWFVYVVDHHEGPFSADELKKLVKKGMAKPTSYVWKNGLDDWMLMSDTTELGAAGSKSDGHGPFAFLTGLANRFSRKPKEPTQTAAAAQAAALAAGGAPSGPDIGNVSPSESVWCLNSGK